MLTPLGQLQRIVFIISNTFRTIIVKENRAIYIFLLIWTQFADIIHNNIITSLD